ncbi:MAG: sulfite exporter TauE/SafE family protein [Acidobacteriota bacterium]|nr:sulfite exporter TauE/SafE family protein [Acidobacteriota bacterium]
MNAYATLAGASFVAGGLNAMAGGGSFFSFPALLAVGVPPVNANATNTVALWPGQIASIVAFRSDLHQVKGMIRATVLASATGGILGAIALLKTDQGTFLKMVPWLILFATILFAVSDPIQRRTQAWRMRRGEEAQTGEPRISAGNYIALSLTCFYIGYFGAGSGFLVITLFSLAGLKGLNQINTLKVVCTSVANGIAVVTFIVAGAVYWREFPLMMFPALAGGYLGAAYSRTMNKAVLRGVIVVTGLALSAYYFVHTI